MYWSVVLLRVAHLVALVSARRTLRASQIACDDGSMSANREECPPIAHDIQASVGSIVPQDAEPDQTFTYTFSAASAETLTYTISAGETVTMVTTTSVFTTTTQDLTVVSTTTYTYTTTVATQTIDVATGTTTVTATTTSVDDETFTTVVSYAHNALFRYRDLKL